MGDFGDNPQKCIFPTFGVPKTYFWVPKYDMFGIRLGFLGAIFVYFNKIYSGIVGYPLVSPGILGYP